MILSELDYIGVVNDYLDGVAIREIMKKYSCSTSSIYNTLKREGVSIRKIRKQDCNKRGVEYINPKKKIKFVNEVDTATDLKVEESTETKVAPVRQCQSCGCEVYEDSIYCHKCGTKIKTPMELAKGIIIDLKCHIPYEEKDKMLPQLNILEALLDKINKGGIVQ